MLRGVKGRVKRAKERVGKDDATHLTFRPFSPFFTAPVPIFTAHYAFWAMVGVVVGNRVSRNILSAHFANQRTQSRKPF